MEIKKYLFKFLIIIGIICPGGVYAQNAKVTLSVTNKPISEVLEQIEEQTDYSFIYDNKIVDTKQIATINAVAENTSSVLDKLFKDKGIAYIYKDKKFVLKKKEIPTKVKIQGVVKDNNDEPIIGANVIVAGTPIGTNTDFDGNFGLEVDAGSKVSISYLGYLTQEVKVNQPEKNLTIRLLEDNKMIDEVVVIGYGSVRKSDLTGAVASIKMDELNQSTPTLESSLIGHTPGVEIKQTSGAPGSGTSMRIRGVTSVYSGVEPLYVIDGYPASKDTYINPSDVASIEVLKDAASAAIYGSRASGGVVLITTKRGKAGKAKVNLSYQLSLQQVARKIDMMDSKQLLELHKDGYNNTYFDYLRANNLYASDEDRWNHSRDDDNAMRTSMGAGSTMLLCPDFFNTDINTDWQDEIFTTAPMHRLNFSLSGGQEGFRYMFSMGYLNQDGIISPSNHERITSRLNMDMDVNSRFSINVNTNMFYVKDREVRSDGLAFNDAIILNTLGMPSMYPVYNEDGEYATGISYKNTIPYTTFAGENPLALAYKTQHRYTRSRYALNADLKYKLIQGLDAKVSGGFQISDQIYRYYRPATNLGSSNYAPGDFENLARASNDRDHNMDYLVEATLSYNRVFKEKHTINAVAGYSMQRKEYDNVDVRALGFTSDRIPEVSGAGPAKDNVDGTTAVTDRAAWSLMSMFARAVYNYDNRYTASATLRSDGCSRFGEENRWGTFPSASAGWNISNERFWKNLDFITAKLRGSWGLSGNNNIGNYRHIPLIRSGSYNFGSNTVTSYYPSGFTDLNLGWEKTSQTNIGLDLGFLNNRINLIANYYYSVTNDLLYQNTVSAITGSTSYWTNLNEGKVYNKGFDLQLDAMVVSLKDFTWRLSGNISLNRNKVKGLKDEIIQKAQRSQITHITRNGLPIGSFYGMVSEGIITKEDYENIKIDALHQGEENYKRLGPPVADYSQVYIGDVKWKDVNGDGKITEDDRDIIGNNYPDYSYGINTKFSYKNFNFSATFDGQQGNDVINFSRYYIANLEGGVNSMAWGTNRYRDENNPGDGSVFRANRAPKNLNTKFSTYFVEDGSFFRCTNMTLGYTAPHNSFLKNLGIETAYVYASVDNLFIITNYSGYNPDVDYNSGNLCPGVDFGTYPLARTWSFGVNLTF